MRGTPTRGITRMKAIPLVNEGRERLSTPPVPRPGMTALPNFTPTTLQGGQEWHPFPTCWPGREASLQKGSSCDHAGSQISKSSMRIESGRAEGKWLHSESPGGFSGVPTAGSSVWTAWESRTGPFWRKGVKVKGMICGRSQASTPLPRAQDRIASKSLRDPIRVLLTPIRCHGVEIVTLFPHVTGGHVKNIAAASCDSAVGDDVTDVVSMYHYPKCDPGQVNSEVNHTCLAVLLIAWEGWDAPPYTAPLSQELTSISHRFHMSGRPPTILWTELGIPIGRVNPLCTAELKGESDAPLSISFNRRPEILCSERDVLGRAMTSLDIPESGGRRGRPGYVEIGTLWYNGKSWLWRDCRDLNLVVTLKSEQNNLVSPRLYTPTHLFSPHTYLTPTDILWPRKTTLFCSLKPDWETEELAPRAPQVPDLASILPRPTAAASTLPLSSSSYTAPQPYPDRAAVAPLPREDMCLCARLCALLLGFAITSSAGLNQRSITLGPLAGLLATASADRFTLRNGYGTVEARYHLTAYDCSDSSEVQAYSSIPASHCSTRATPVRKDRATRFQLLQKERKRYINAYVCSLFRTDIRYNCGIYGHPELDPMHWSFLIPQRVTVEQCLEWLRTRTYRLEYHSTMMHGKEFAQPIHLEEPNYIPYLVYGRTFPQAPALPTDQVKDISCQGEWYEYQPGQPQNHIIAFYDELHLQTVTLVVEEDKVIDKDRQLSLPCPWNDGHCHAEGLTYLWNVTGPEYCPVAVVKEFLGHRLHANVSHSGDSSDSHQAEAIVSAEVEEKIRIQPTGPVSQCGRVVTSTNIEDMFLFPILETDDKGRVLTDNREQVFERRIHPGEVDLRKYIANRDEYLYYDITSKA